MTEMLRIDDKIKNLQAYFSKRPEILAVFLFGSYGTAYQTALSDVDFAVLFDKKIGLDGEAVVLAGLSDRLGTDRIDLVNLKKAPLSLQFRALSEGKIVYERDYIATCDFIEKVIDLYQDYAIDLNYYYKEYDEALKEAYDVANHIAARNRWRTPGTSSEALGLLEQNGYFDTGELDTFN